MHGRSPVNRFREHGIALGMALAFVGMGLVGIVGAWGAYLTDIRIERHGARAEGQLLAKRIAASADGDADHRVRYRFTPAEGPAIDRELGVGKRLWDSLHEGQVIEVRYSSASPKRNFPAGAGVTSLGLVVFVSVVAGLCVALGGLLFAGCVRRVRAKA